VSFAFAAIAAPTTSPSPPDTLEMGCVDEAPPHATSIVGHQAWIRMRGF
jgi:hypothetical protein